MFYFLVQETGRKMFYRNRNLDRWFRLRQSHRSTSVLARIREKADFHDTVTVFFLPICCISGNRDFLHFFPAGGESGDSQGNFAVPGPERVCRIFCLPRRFQIRFYTLYIGDAMEIVLTSACCHNIPNEYSGIDYYYRGSYCI